MLKQFGDHNTTPPELIAHEWIILFNSNYMYNRCRHLTRLFLVNIHVNNKTLIAVFSLETRCSWNITWVLNTLKTNKKNRDIEQLILDSIFHLSCFIEFPLYSIASVDCLSFEVLFTMILVFFSNIWSVHLSFIVCC